MPKASPRRPLTREQQRAAAIVSLREDWCLAQESGLDKLTDAEIAEVRAERLRRRESNPRP